MLDIRREYTENPIPLDSKSLNDPHLVSSIYSERIEADLNSLPSPIEQRNFLVEQIRAMQNIQATAGNIIRLLLWNVHKRGLWTLPNEYGEIKYEGPLGFRNWVMDNFLSGSEGKEVSKGYWMDLVRQIEGPVAYVHLNPVLMPGSLQPITAEDLLMSPNIKKLKTVRNEFVDSIEGNKVDLPDTTRSSRRDTIIRDVMTKGNDYIKKTYAPQVIIRVPFTRHYNPDGTVDVHMESLNEEQYEVLKTFLESVGEEIGEVYENR